MRRASTPHTRCRGGFVPQLQRHPSSPFAPAGLAPLPRRMLSPTKPNGLHLFSRLARQPRSANVFPPSQPPYLIHCPAPCPDARQGSLTLTRRVGLPLTHHERSTPTGPPEQPAAQGEEGSRESVAQARHTLAVAAASFLSCSDTPLRALLQQVCSRYAFRALAWSELTCKLKRSLTERRHLQSLCRKRQRKRSECPQKIWRRQVFRIRTGASPHIPLGLEGRGRKEGVGRWGVLTA